MEENITNVIVSIIILGAVVSIIKLIEYKKFRTLSGSHKATTVIFIFIGIAEAVYVSMTLHVLTPALETVTSLSALLLFFTFIYLNKLQNAVSGMSIALGSRINLGNTIEFEGKQGVIVQIGLTKTIVQLMNSEKQLIIPNKKFDEEVSIISKKSY